MIMKYAHQNLGGATKRSIRFSDGQLTDGRRCVRQGITDYLVRIGIAILRRLFADCKRYTASVCENLTTLEDCCCNLWDLGGHLIRFVNV